MVRYGIFALIGAAVLGYMTYTEGSLAFNSSPEPEPITLKNLLARGAEGNAYILLTDFVLCSNLVYKSKNNKDWTNVWIPIVTREEVDPRQKEPPQPKEVKALFFSNRIDGQAALETRLNQPKVQAMITNRISSLENDVRKLLQEAYPGTDFNTCLIIQEGRTPHSRGAVYAMGGGAGLALLLGIGLVAKGWLGKSSPPASPAE
jgi:hypothetical protein